MSCSNQMFKHYRLVLSVVGRGLTTFTSTKELLTAVRDAMQAHWEAFVIVKLLHRDISTGNIIIYNGGGLLIDWEVAKDVNEVGGRRQNRMGTWRFMSAALLKNADKKPELADDLESFLHVLAWMVLHYLPAPDNYLTSECQVYMKMFDESFYLPEFESKQGGERKADKLGRGSYFSQCFEPKKPTPLCSLIHTLASPFKSFYHADPPTEFERAKYKVMPTNGDRDDMRRWAAVDEYEENMEYLKSSTWFLTTIDRALEKAVLTWPTDDEADKKVYVPWNSPGTQTPFRVQIQVKSHSTGGSLQASS